MRLSVALLLLSTGLVVADNLEWWRTASLYQVYPRSFFDSEGRGIGNIEGVREKASYFKKIGVDAIWMSPIFKSPMADMGYDISDYTQVDPLFGTNKDLKALLETLHDLGIKLLLDLVPNHTSDEHEWFQKSVRKEGKYTDYYVWVDGTKGTPPNNWVSNFSGGAWEWNEQRGQYYLHQFMIKQPDLNYRNPHVVQEMDDIILYWLNFGADGFRVDAVPFLFEDKELRDNPVTDGVVGDIRTQNLPETYELTRHWAELVYNYSKEDNKERALYLEAYASLNQTLALYGTGDNSLMQPFNFFLITEASQTSRPEDYKRIILEWYDNMPVGASANWVLGNHDRPRAANRYSPQLVDAMNIMTLFLPGCKVTYYGEEIGMSDTFIRWDQTQDPAALMLGPDKYLQATRDPERTPMQWDDSKNAGFSTNDTTWLPVNPNYYELNVANQEKAETSHLKVFQTVSALRKDPVLRSGSLKVLVHDIDTLVILRKLDVKFYILVINMGSFSKTYKSDDFFKPNGLDENLIVVTSSVNAGYKTGVTMVKGSIDITLRPQAAILLKNPGELPPDFATD